MLRFDNVPPKSPDEVNFTDVGKSTLEQMKRHSDADFITIGRTLGSIVVDNSGESPTNPNLELAEQVVAHLEEQVGGNSVISVMKGYLDHLVGAQNV